MLEHDPRLRPGQLCAETIVGSAGEREVWVRVPSDIECIRPVEYVGVAMRGARPEDHELAFTDTPAHQGLTRSARKQYEAIRGHVAYLGHGGGGHTTWHCRTCDAVVYGPPLNVHCTALQGPAPFRVSSKVPESRKPEPQRLSGVQGLDYMLEKVAARAAKAT